eukprot:767737-Hanusia_phi.AAC.4
MRPQALIYDLAFVSGCPWPFSAVTDCDSEIIVIMRSQMDDMLSDAKTEKKARMTSELVNADGIHCRFLHTSDTCQREQTLSSKSSLRLLWMEITSFSPSFTGSHS